VRDNKYQDALRRKSLVICYLMDLYFLGLYATDCRYTAQLRVSFSS
jgi:hypothetical protein